MSVIALIAVAGINSPTERDQAIMTEEADNWIDEMPDGLQDRISDAVNHSMSGFNSEIEYFRNIADTAGVSLYKVNIENLTPTELNGVSLRFYKSTLGPSAKPLLIYFHGGGWSLGSVNTSELFCRALTAKGGVNVVSVEYPLAPEHTSVAIEESCVGAVKYIFENVDKLGSEKSLISLGGDGAGGYLALQSYAKLPDQIGIRSLVLYYPILDTKGPLDARMKREYGRGYGFDSRLWESFIKVYNGEDPSFYDKKLPPVLLIAAGRDILYESEKNFSSGNTVNFVSFDGAIHGFLTDNKQKTAFLKAVSITDNFLRE